MCQTKKQFSILIIDDSLIARKKMAAFLKKMNFIVTEATNGKEGIATIKTGRFDLVMLDLQMPELDGFGVLKHLKKIYNKVPIIVLSADIQDASKDLCKELGAFAFINKPPTKEEVLSSIEAALDSGIGSK